MNTETGDEDLPKRTPEKKRVRNAIYAASHREETREKYAVWYSNPENAEKTRQRMLEYRRKKNPALRDKIKKTPEEQKQAKKKHDAVSHPLWMAKNRDRARAQVVAWRSLNKEKMRAYHQNRRALKRNAIGTHTNADILELMSSQGNSCAYCGASLVVRYHVDHIQALSRGGSNWPSNLQLLCPSCNSRKHVRDHDSFLEHLTKSTQI